ncbi:hypothetical protein LTR27_006691 [Elasticomyces elasticus]|nr:hypothetical protein LTR27_006691 [Elasticomyces elasticus]
MGQLCSGTERETDAPVSSDNLEEKNRSITTSVRAMNIQSEALQQPPNSESAPSRNGAAEEINPIDAHKQAERKKAEELLKELQERRRQWPRMPPNSELLTHLEIAECLQAMAIGPSLLVGGTETEMSRSQAKPFQHLRPPLTLPPIAFRPAPPAVPLSIEHLKHDRVRVQTNLDALSMQIAEHERKIAAAKASRAMMERFLQLVEEEIARRETAA